MNIIEVKNSLIKLCYEDNLALAGFIKITDNKNSYIAQILHLEAARIGKIAIAKLIFKYNNGISAYDGSIPSLRAELEPIDSSVLLNSLEHSDPLNLCNLAQQQNKLTVNFDILKDNPIICAEKFFTTKVLLNNLALQLQARKQKIVVFDTSGVFKTNKVTITKDFKLPLNTSTINYIYEKGFEDATAESKAMIQAIFEELSEYSKTVSFIPFDTFKAVIDSEFMRTRLMQLVILKNKIKQIRDWNVFAQTEQDFEKLKTKLETENTVVIDISCLQESLQKECIKYIYSVLGEINSEFYAFTPLSNDNSDKFILKQIFDTENVHTSIICGYDYNNLAELKKCSKNMLMFTPLKQQKDFGGYNIFLQKLAEDEFIAYGKMTKFVPLIAKLHQLRPEEIYTPKITETITQIQAQPEPVVKEPEAEEIPQPVPDTELKEENEITIEPVILEEEPQPEENTEVVTPFEEKEEETIETTQTEEAIIPETEDVQEDLTEQVQEDTAGEQVVEEIIEDTEVIEEVQSVPSQEETITQEPEPAAATEETTAEPVPDVVAEDEPVEPKSEPVIKDEPVEPEQVIEEKPETQKATEVNEVEEALQSVPEIEDDEELSDDDLDMIEELSKPDDEIPVINQEPPVEPAPLPQENIVQEPEPADTTEDEPQSAPMPQPPQTEEEEIQNAQMPAAGEPLQTRANTTPIVPVYPSDIPEEDKVNSDAIQQGDKVVHEEFGEGVVEKMINYGDKLLCSVNFTSVGRRLLNPEISEMKKVQ